MLLTDKMSNWVSDYHLGVPRKNLNVKSRSLIWLSLDTTQTMQLMQQKSFICLKHSN